jgi:predicted Fe-Mo cluster-binding NifX family protein
MMRIAFTSAGTTWDSLIDPRFGRTEYIALYDEDNKEFTSVDNSAVKNDAHGAGTATAQKIFELKPDVLITGNGPGENAAKALKLIEMKIFVDAHDQTIQQAYQSFLDGALKEI